LAPLSCDRRLYQLTASSWLAGRPAAAAALKGQLAGQGWPAASIWS